MKLFKKILTAAILMSLFILTACSTIKKIEKQTKYTSEKVSKPKVSEMIFETKSISEIRSDIENSISVLGTDSSKYGNIDKTDIIPIITDENEIYNIKLTKSEGNDLTKTGSFNDDLQSKSITKSYEVYRNDKKKIKTKLNITDGTDIEDLINFVENDMDSTYADSPFKWFVEYINVHTTSDKKDFVNVGIRPSYDGVVFTKTLAINDGIPLNGASDFRKGLLNITSMNKIDEYYDISPYYTVERQGEAIGEILSVESILSIVANKINKDHVNEIKLFELAYKLNRDLSAVPIWNIVINEFREDIENYSIRNFQIDAVSGDMYFE